MATKPRAAKTQAHQGSMRIEASITGAGEGVGGLEISGSAALVGTDKVGGDVKVGAAVEVGCAVLVKGAVAARMGFGQNTRH